jgi:propionyl-CoA carboxylase alpha chain
VDGVRVRATVRRGDLTWVGWFGVDIALAELPRLAEPERTVVEGGLAAPMNGTIVMLEAQEGMRVAAGQALVVIEAMKMEHSIAAPRAGVVSQVLTSRGASVSADEILVVLGDEEPAEEPVEVGSR